MRWLGIKCGWKGERGDGRGSGCEVVEMEDMVDGRGVEAGIVRCND